MKQKHFLFSDPCWTTSTSITPKKYQIAKYSFMIKTFASSFRLPTDTIYYMYIHFLKTTRLMGISLKPDILELINNLIKNNMYRNSAGSFKRQNSAMNSAI